MTATPTNLRTPYARVLPPLTTAEYEALRISVEQEGVKHPAEATEDGRVLDGHTRLRIRPDAPVRVVPGSAGWSDDECFAYIVRANDHRRNLSPEQKRALLKEKQSTACRLRQAAPERFTEPALAR